MSEDEEVIMLLQWILTWMSDNDYECGEVGAEIFEEINKMLNRIVP